MFKISVSPEVSFLTILVFIIFSSKRECREYFRPLLRRAQFNLHIVKPAWHIVCFCPERCMQGVSQASHGTHYPSISCIQVLVSQVMNEQMYSLIGYLGPRGYQLYKRQSLVQAFWIQSGSVPLGCPIF
uniref:Putative secreted protein n=1 Tax=Ixodes scapularis TaxID=6945 RepID=A0A4D5RDS0_IXOSC